LELNVALRAIQETTGGAAGVTCSSSLRLRRARPHMRTELLGMSTQVIEQRAALLAAAGLFG
jgi:hypothetical protein